MRHLLTLIACGCLMATCSVASAVPLTFFGEDLGLGEGTALAAHPNADAARTAFLANLVGVGTEDLEGFADGTTAPLTLDFGAAGQATLNGDGFIDVVASGSTNGAGRYATSGTHFWESRATFSIAFTEPQAAFGFYGVDIGDFNGQVTLTLTGGGTTNLTVPNTVNGLGGAVLYYGVIATNAADTFSSLTFGNTSGESDAFAFDDMTIGTLEQVNVVPEPVTMAGLILGVGSLAGYLRRRK